MNVLATGAMLLREAIDASIHTRSETKSGNARAREDDAANSG